MIKHRFLCFILFWSICKATEALAETGIVQGHVFDVDGNPIVGAIISIDQLDFSAITDQGGDYQITGIPDGIYTLRVTASSYSPQSATIMIEAGQTVTQNFSLLIDIHAKEDIVVTGSVSPEKKIESSASISTLTTEEINDAAPRSTTEYLRRIPGFTRVESSGGEVNQNLTVRGLLGFASVNFQEDGMMVYPSMEIFWMNADNLIRLDENLEKVEILRGGTSPIFGSSTAGATLNFLNKTGGSELHGVWGLSAGTSGLARFDFNVNGPLLEDWRFNVGGFFRYDHGVRDPGYPGTKGGQLKANVTRLLSNGFFRISVKHIDDSNLFILPLPMQNQSDPEFVPGFSENGSNYSSEGITQIPLPTGDQLPLPLDDGIQTKGTWLTGQVNFNFGEDWHFENISRVMSVQHNWNALASFDILDADDFAQMMLNQYIQQGFVPESSTYQFLFTNHFDFSGDNLQFNTANGLVRRGGIAHIQKPISDFSNLLTIRKKFGPHYFSFGTHFAYYTQNNNWYLTNVLTDVRDNPRFLDLVFVQPDGSTLDVTKNGFERFLGFYLNAEGNNTLIAFFTSDEFKVTDRLRIDLGIRYERANYFLINENFQEVDLDNDPRTQYDIEGWRNGTFNHFDFDIDDIAFSTGANYQIFPDRLAVYGSFTRGFKLPPVDEFIFETNQEFIDLFKPYNTNMFEAGIKYSDSLLTFSAAVYYARLYNQLNHEVIFVPETGSFLFRTTPLRDSSSWGMEFEILAKPTKDLGLRGTTTLVSVETPEVNLTGQFYDGLTPAVFDFETSYSILQNTRLIFDWHYVGTRYADSVFSRKLSDFSYFNLVVSHKVMDTGFTITGRILNLTQSKGLEERFPVGDPILNRESNYLLARPILPRRYTAELRYEF